ncbi:beta-lactamase/transpeptidase-like protein [Mycena maculata]|uniref:Beta-lactamase/transpeptidase-like protein n=1 Tax=Mycena maculata TaxID=230809 RepID=A0AAD7KC96_9AGAR|nr:beta-lactamase/transpeptidase-like protein [Mycena maculata]
MHLWQNTLVGLISVVLGAHYTGFLPLPRLSSHQSTPDETERFSCRPFLPPLFVHSPPHIDDPLIKAASLRTGQFLESRFSKKDIDSLSVAVVSSNGVLFEANYGVMRGNESGTSPATTSDSMYRIASVSKLFTVLEGHILAEKGVISWDDPVNKYLPDFKPRLDATSATEPSVTLFQLANHMSGLGRDWPPGNVANWPKDLFGAGPPPTNGLPFPDHASLFRAIEKNPLVSHPYAIPGYSNTGIGVLGLALVAANRIANGPREPSSYATLLERDIFDPLGLNGSHFLTTDNNKHLVVVPSLAPEVADQDFLDAMNPAGGQFSSLRDSITVLQTLLNPSDQRSLITKQTMDSWMHTFHAFEEDDLTEVGFLWEIVKARDSNNRFRKIYWKLGAMAGYHAALAIHPGTSYGVAVLLGGHYPDAAKIAYDVFELFQPAIDHSLADLANSMYAGKWTSSDGKSSATVSVDKGTLYVEHLDVNGTDILSMFNSPHRVALRWTHHDKFRLDIGIPFYNGKMHMGCYPYWVGMDLWGMRDGNALNAIEFSGDETGRRLHVPAIGMEMTRGR